jgi:thioredoxin-related protein
MKNILFSLIILTFLVIDISGQDTLMKPYQPEANAQLQIKNAIMLADAAQKHILIMVGGNWCKWCIRLTKFMAEHETIDSIIKADYVYIHINYSPENKNAEVMQQLEYPQRFGFPVLVILDSNGKKIHTQNTAYIEKDDSYNIALIKEFLLQWNYKALHSF